MAIHDNWSGLEYYLGVPVLKGTPLAPVILTALVVSLVYASYTLFESKPDISHIPVLGAELGFKGRKHEFERNAKAFLQRGYEEVSKNPSRPIPREGEV